MVTAGIEEQGLNREMYGIVTLGYNFFCCIVVLVWVLLTYTHSVLLYFHSSYLLFCACVCVYVCVCIYIYIYVCVCVCVCMSIENCQVKYTIL